MKCLRGGSRLMQWLGAVSLVCVLAACSSGGDGSGGGTTPVATPSVGVFVDSPVQGLGYTSVPSGLTGLTNASGQYNYLPGDTVTFTLYGRSIGVAVPAGPVVTALLVFNATSLTDPQVVNLSQLLLTLAGGAPAAGNPIVLPVTAPPNFPATINFSGAGFDTSFPGLTLVSEATATTHLQSSFKTLAVTIVNSGTVTSAPAGINCTAGVCSAVFTSGTVVTLTATGTGFTGWGNGTGSATCTGTGTCAVTLNADSSVTATFPVAPPPATVTILPNGGTGTGSVTCSANGGAFAACAGSYPSGTPLVFRATANAGSTFTGWSDGMGNTISCNGTAIDCPINVTADSVIRANFTLPVLNSVTGTIATANGGGGVVTCSANGGAAGPCGIYPVGSAIVMTATPNSVSNFSGWSGAGCSGTGTCSFTLTADTTVTANFNRPTLTLVVVGAGTVSSNPVGIDNCTTSCTAPFDRGSSVTLTAGTGLSAWSGGGCSGVGPCVVPLSGDITITTTFGGGGGVGGGTLTVSNGPASVGGTFVADPQFTSAGSSSGVGSVVWGEPLSQSFTHTENVGVGFNMTTGEIGLVEFTSIDVGIAGAGWACLGGPLASSPCSGVTINRTAGTVSFTNTVLLDPTNTAPPVTLNGTLSFAPFSITAPSTLPVGTINVPYSTSLATFGGTGALSWSIIAGVLPIGLTLDSSTGVISGTPTTQGTFAVTIQVQDGGNPPQSTQKAFTLTIHSATSGGESLTVTGAPARFGESFEPDPQHTRAGLSGVGIGAEIHWRQPSLGAGSFDKAFAVGVDLSTGQFVFAVFGGFLFAPQSPDVLGWDCRDLTGHISCGSATVSRSAGTATFTNFVLADESGVNPPITLNGTLSFPPF